MADKDHLPVYQLPRIESNGGNEKFEEESAVRSDESQEDLRKSKRIQYLVYFMVFLVFQTGIILLFALTIMKVRTPKFRVRSATFETFDVVGITTATANPSFHLRMNADLELKNNNFGDYKFRNSTVYFFHNSNPVGEAVVPKSKAGIRSTKKFKVLVNLLSSTSKDPKLASDLGSGVITLRSQSKLSGKVELIKVLKKKKSTNMDCTLTIVVADRALRQITCK